jgi:hypothetical protein
MSVYINGVDDGGSYSGTGGSLAYSSGNATIATSHYDDLHFEGEIDDVRIYDRALSAEEVQELWWEARLPIVHWRFDEGEGDTAYDSAGDHDGTVYGAQWTEGMIDGALDFDGHNDYVDFGDIDELEFGDEDFSVSFWFNTAGPHDDGGGGGKIVSKYNYGTGRQWAFTQKQFYEGRIYWYTSPDGSTREDLISEGSEYENEWVHVVGVREGATKLLYIDCVLDNTGPTDGVITGKSTKVLVGAFQDPSHTFNFFNGKIDDVRVYNRALSAEEIEEFCVGGLPVAVDIKPGSCPNPVNVKSKGVLPVAILGAEEFDVNSIDAVSVRLAGVEPLRSSYEDVASPAVDGNECPCSEEGPDGYRDLTLKFETQEVVEALGEVNDRDVLTVRLTGVLQDGTPIEGMDCILVHGRFKPFNRGDINKNGVTDIVDFAMMAETWLESTNLD